MNSKFPCLGTLSQAWSPALNNAIDYHECQSLFSTSRGLKNSTYICRLSGFCITWSILGRCRSLLNISRKIREFLQSVNLQGSLHYPTVPLTWCKAHWWQFSEDNAACWTKLSMVYLQRKWVCLEKSLAWGSFNQYLCGLDEPLSGTA